MSRDLVPRRLAHYLYLADLVRDRRILEVGCGDGRGAHFLASCGAARVVGIDRSVADLEVARARFGQANLEFRCEAADELELEDGAFDCVFVPEGASALRRGTVLRELRRVLRQDGHLILGVASAERRGGRGGATYDELRERLEPAFGPVRIIGQAPLRGVALAELGDDEEIDVELDTTLVELGAGPAELTDYVALCGGGPAAPRPLVVVELPGGDEAEAEVFEAPAAIVAPPRPQLGRVVAERDELAARVAELELERSQRRPAWGPGDSPSEQIAAALALAAADREGLEQALAEARAWAVELTAERDAARAERAAQGEAGRAAEARTQELAHELGVARRRAAVAEGGLLAARGGEPVDDLAHLAAALDEERAILGRLEAGIGELGRELAATAAAAAPSGWAAHRDEQLRELASDLGVKDAEIAILQVGVAALRARLAEVVGEVKGAIAGLRARAPGEVAGLVDALAARMARYEAR